MTAEGSGRLSAASMRANTAERPYTVTELQRIVRLHLEERFPDVWVTGEISDLTLASSGHAYFSLKDPGAVLRAVAWRSTVGRLRFRLEEGLKVRARGRLTVYEARGSYQMTVEALEPEGTGPLQIAFEQLVKKLRAEGLFEEARKLPIPVHARRIALVTSPTGAVVRDFIKVARRRWPSVSIVVVPVRVQGEGSVEEIAEGVRAADRLGADVIVVARGGGSLEDLWSFNDERVARAIAAAETPIVSAVGHETDVTIADFVADLRAPTPSAAAELVVPNRAEAAARTAELRLRMGRALHAAVADGKARLFGIARAAAFRRPLDRYLAWEQGLDDLAARLVRAMRERRRAARDALRSVAARIEALSPMATLARGYSVTRRAGRAVRRADEIAVGERVETLFHEGRMISERVE